MDANDTPFLPQNPPARIVRLVAWLLCALAVTAAAVAIFVRWPETVHVRFALVSPAGEEAVLAPMAGVLTRVDVREGATVSRGDVLFVLRSDEIRHWQTERATDLEELRALGERRAKLGAIWDAQVAIKQAQIAQLEREVAFREKHVDANRYLATEMEKLVEKGGVSRIEMLNHRLDLAASEKDLAVAEKAVQQQKLELEQMKTEWQRQELEEDSKANQLRIGTAALDRQLADCEGDTRLIRAPYNAVVTALDRHGDGNAVAAGTPLMQLARNDGRLEARLRLDEPALARLRAGQRVRYFFDAYPYQRYGTATGELRWITPAAVPDGATSQFLATAGLDTTSLPGATGSPPLVLRVGMQGEARIVVGRRTLVESVFEPIRRLRENLRP